MVPMSKGEEGSLSLQWENYLWANREGGPGSPPQPQWKTNGTVLFEAALRPYLSSRSLASENVKSGYVWKQGSPETAAWPVIYLSPPPCPDDGMERNTLPPHLQCFPQPQFKDPKLSCFRSSALEEKACTPNPDVVFKTPPCNP
ncbi:UNVERIFIED_CONTAM: hypothetical protein K2H54_049583 [Gekko kuhli]